MIKPLSLALAIAAAVSSASAQGLLSIGSGVSQYRPVSSDEGGAIGLDPYQDKLPFTTTVASSVGWDSNMNSSATDEHESGYWNNGISVLYPAIHSRTTKLNVGASYSNIWYFDPAPGTDDLFHNGRLTIDFMHNVNRRLTIFDNFYVSYEVEPDYQIGASTNRRTAQYLYGYNNAGFTYRWSNRFSTTTSYTISGIEYEDEEEFGGDNRIVHHISQDLRYALSRVTSVNATYRYAYGDYDAEGADYTSHFILAGATHFFSPRTTGSINAGVELRDYDVSGNETAPYVEAQFTHRLSRKADVRWYGWYGLDDSDRSGYDEQISLRTGISGSYQLADRLTGSIGAHYIMTDYSGGDAASIFGSDRNEDLISFSVGLEYRLWRNVSLDANYYFTKNMSDLDIREFDRHRVSLGVKATF
jgi:hypothetical protein